MRCFKFWNVRHCYVVCRNGVAGVFSVWRRSGRFYNVEYAERSQVSVFTFSYGLNYSTMFYFNSRLAQVVKVMLALAIFVTYGLQCYVAVDIAWNEYLGVKFEQNKRQLFWEYFTRTGLVLVTCEYLQLAHTCIP